MYLRTVLGSRPVRRAIDVTDSPCRCNSSIIMVSPSRIIGTASHGRLLAPILALPNEPGLTPAHWQPGPTIREFSKPTFAENYTPTDVLLTIAQVTRFTTDRDFALPQLGLPRQSEI